MQTTDGPVTGAVDVRLGETVQTLLDEAVRDGERRSEPRQPFFRTIQLAFVRDPTRRFTCFSRDISTSGIGLLHYMELPLGTVVLTIPTETSGPVRFLAEMVWSHPCGDGWHMSGARFLEPLPPAPEE